MEGSVLRAGDRVRIMVQLIDASADRHLWADSYERDVRDVFALQADVAKAVAREVEVTLSPEEQTRLASMVGGAASRRPDPEAYDSYLKGRHYVSRWMLGGAPLTAIRHFEEAVARDPTFAEAYAALALSYLLPSFSLEQLGEGKAAALKAVDLDATLSEGHNSLAIARMIEWDWNGSETAFQQAIALNPNPA